MPTVVKCAVQGCTNPCRPDDVYCWDCDEQIRSIINEPMSRLQSVSAYALVFAVAVGVIVWRVFL